MWKAVATVLHRHKKEKQMRAIIQLLIVFCLFASSSPLLAQWVQTNGTRGFQIQCFAGSGTNLFAGNYDGGVFLSTNNGKNWTAVNSGMTGSIVQSLVVSPNGTGGTNLFAGTSGGVFLSTNDGTSWTAVNSGLTDTSVNALAVSPNGTGGTNLFAGTQDGGGVYLSTDNGTSWTATSSGILKTIYDASRYISVWAITVSPNGTGGTNLFAGTDNGVYLSTDNGTSWSAVSTGLPSTVVYQYSIVHSFAVVGTDLFAQTWGGNIYVSTNNGTSWTRADSGLANTLVQSLVASGTNLFAGTYGDGIFLSTNNGTSWTAASTGIPSTVVQVLAVYGPNLFAGTYNSAVWRRPLSEMIAGEAK